MAYNIADCFVSSSLNEGFGLPQLEAISCGCPVVTANNSGMIEVSLGAGILVDGWDSQNWVDKIVWASNNKNIIITNYDEKLSHYDWNNIIVGLMKFIS